MTVQNAGHYAGLSTRRLRRWAVLLLAEVAPDGDSLSVRLTSDREIRRLNDRYRGRDKSTDVLSFPGGSTPEGRHLGDVVISVPTARRQAARRGRSFERELRSLVLHGILHCLGYDHETDDGTMRRLESRLGRRWIER